MTTLPTKHTQQLTSFLEKMRVRPRLVFAIDATASRGPSWVTARATTGEMFKAVGGLDVQLCYYKGEATFFASPWVPSATLLLDQMAGVTCAMGETQIGKVLAHVKRENAKQKVAALVLIGDAAEETPLDLLYAALDPNVPIFAFLEGNLSEAEEVFQELARRSHGAFARFDPDAAKELADLLKAVAVYAAGGVAALADQHSSAAVKLLGQLKDPTP